MCTIMILLVSFGLYLVLNELLCLFRTHARDMDNKEFWKVYYEHLEMVAGLAGEFSMI